MAQRVGCEVVPAHGKAHFPDVRFKLLDEPLSGLLKSFQCGRIVAFLEEPNRLAHSGGLPQDVLGDT